MRHKLLAACLVLVSTAQPSWAAASYMVGTWFGHGQPENKDSMYIDRMRADGSWQGEYRNCARGRAGDQIQVGRWSLNGDILTLTIDTVDGVAAPRIDAYKMLAHSNDSQKYLSMTWNYPYTPQRVANDFQMPSCPIS